MARFDIATQKSLGENIEREFLLTNHAGSFASTTLAGCNTRRYHGLLCAAVKPPLARVMALARIGEIVIVNGNAAQPHELSVNQFNHAVHPHGYEYLTNFTLEDSTATWTFELPGVVITKALQLSELKPQATVSYTVKSSRSEPIELNLLVFTGLRDFHSLRRVPGDRHHMKMSDTPTQVAVEEGGLTLTVAGIGARFVRKPDWWTDHIYYVETERGQDDREDLFTPGHFSAVMPQGSGTVTLTASLMATKMVAGGSFSAAVPPARATETVQRLVRAAEDFLVRRDLPAEVGAKPVAGATVLAGYPWFSDWGRDTMISLPGLLLTTKRFDEAGAVLKLFADHVSEGMIPNRFAEDTLEPEYNTVDASLWFIHAAFEYRNASKDEALFKSVLLPACKEIVRGHRAGTRYHIRVDPSDGLLAAGDESTQLTWMDVKFEGKAFTPRHGKAVEINALWYHALVLLGEKEEAARVAKSFRSAFVPHPRDATTPGLYDTVRGIHKDKSRRPNQIFAVSLPNSPLTADEQRAVVDDVTKYLLTPVGLRSLCALDRGYIPRYAGHQGHRDAAYHNGTVWSWLIGPFLDAYLRVNGDSAAAKAQAKLWLQPLIDHMNNDACIGQISEIFEGDAPHRAVGACAQAWSVAEALRLAIRLGM